ncbi:sensor histidine kinase [Chitinophagaceae bacterium MMS25-I14]
MILVIFAAGVIKVTLKHVGGTWGMELAAADAGISIALLLLGTWGLLIGVNAYPTRVGAQLYSFLVAVALAGIVTLIDVQLLRWWAAPADRDFTQWVGTTTLIRFFVSVICFGWIASMASLQKRMAKLEKDFRQQADASSLLREAELFKLRQQLQPHFLYNSLNSISALVLIQPDKAQEMIGRLSDFLRSSVKREANDKIAIAQELEYIEAYLSIEAVRFGDRLEVQVHKDNLDDAVIPPFLLQPVLENAIKFGLYGKTGHVKIVVHMALEADMLMIYIINPFDENLKPPSGTGFGLDSIRRRLYLLYARTDLLETQTDEDLFTTIIKIPQHV